MFREEYAFERHLGSYDQLALAISDNGLVLRRYSETTGTVLSVEREHAPKQLASDVVKRLLVQNAIEEEMGILNNCFDVARRALVACNASGVLGGWGTSDMIVYANHYISWMDLEGSVMAFDLTASHNIDRAIGNFNVLAISGTDIHDLVETTEQIYGGDWEVDDRF